jgi:hypothetical protein
VRVPGARRGVRARPTRRMLGLPEETHHMSTDPNPTQSTPSQTSLSQTSPSPAAPSRRFKPRELQLPDGGRLVLNAEGSIAQLDGDGKQLHEWAPADPEWASHAIRFGLFPQDATVAPTGRYVDDMRPPRR